MSATRIEEIIELIYDYIENCKPTLRSSQNKIVVQKDELLDLVDELKRRTPDEIRRYQKIIANRETIIKQAEEEADAIIEEAHVKAQDLVNETEIMQQAYKQANDLIQNATADSTRIRQEANEYATTIRSGVLNYSSDILSEIESILSTAHTEIQTRTDSLIAKLAENLNTVRDNRGEIIDQLNTDFLGGGDDDDDDEGEYTEEEYSDEDF